MTTISISSWELAAIPITNIKHLSNNSSRSLPITGVEQHLRTTFRTNLVSRSYPLPPSSKASFRLHWGPPPSTCSSMMTWTRRRERGFWRQSRPTRKELTRSIRSKRQRVCSNRNEERRGRTSCNSGPPSAPISLNRERQRISSWRRTRLRKRRDSRIPLTLGNASSPTWKSTPPTTWVEPT